VQNHIRAAVTSRKHPDPDLVAIASAQLFYFFVGRVMAASRAELLQLQPVLRLLLILRLRVVAVLAITALQRDDFSHPST
jgi:hypothetical protein